MTKGVFLKYAHRVLKYKLDDTKNYLVHLKYGNSYLEVQYSSFNKTLISLNIIAVAPQTVWPLKR